MRALHASASFVVALASIPAAFAQPAPSSPSGATASPPAATASPPNAQPSPGAQPTPDVPTPPGSAQTPPPTVPPAPAPTGPVESPGATTSSSAPSSPAMLGVNVPRDKGDTDREPAPARAPDAWQDGHALGVEAMFRGGSRIGQPSVAADTQEKAGLGFDLGAWFRIARAFSLGLSLRRTDLGNISYTSGASTVNAGYASTALEFGARVYPFRWSAGEVFLGLHAGLVWQDVDANGLRPSVNLEPPQVFECSDSAGPGFALSAEIGGAIRLTRAFWLLGNVSGDGYQLTSNLVGNCVSGLGTTTTVSAGIGVLYAFDLGREARVSTTQAPARF